MSTTLGDIAELVGVSQNTVSRALRKKSDISTGTAQRVQKAAKALRYKPNVASRALRYNRFHSIGMLIGGSDDFYLPQQMLGSFSQTLAEDGYTCSLVCAGKMDSECFNEIPLLRDRLVDSMVIGYTQELPTAIVEEISKMDIPVVWLNRWFDHDSVVVGEADAIDQLMAHLSECSYRRVMYVDYTTGGTDSVNHHRLRALDAAAERHKIQPLRMAHRRVLRPDRYAATRSWLSMPDRPRAVIVSELTAAQAILETALHMGLKVPEDLAICSFDNGRRWGATIPTITCAIRPEAEFGIAAATMAMAKSLKSKEPIASQEIKYTLAIGGSTVAEKSCVNQAHSRGADK